MTKQLTRIALILTLVVLSSQNQCSAQEAATAVEESDTAAVHVEKIEKLLSAYQEYDQFNGAVLVAEHGKPVLRQGFGLANMEWMIPNTPDTKFRIGSVTKQFTAALILQLVEEGAVELSKPITTYLTGYRKDTGDKVTVHQLLNHTSGIPSYTTPDFFENHCRESYELDEFVKRFASGDLQFEPGSQYSYNNSGYHLLGAIIEKVTGNTYAEALSQRILEPVGMSNSGFDVSATILKNRAQGYSKTPDGYVNADYLDMGIPYSAGSMYSTVDDLFKWDRALLENKVLSAASIELMQTPNLRDYGYGVDINEHEIGESGEKTKVIQHGGGVHGFNCLLTRLVDQNHTVILLDNVGLGQHHGDITNSIVNILNDQPFDKPKKSIADLLHKIATEEGSAATIAKYKSVKNEQPEIYDFGNEEALNQLGYHLISLEKLEDAIEIFKLNVEMFPEAFNPYDSLGEAYLLNDQTELALTNYKKSVELNPENEGGLLAIKKIEGTETKVDPAMLEVCVGKYELQPGMVVTITFEDGVLMGEPTGQEKVALEAISETAFFVPAVKGNVEFIKNDDGKVTGMKLKQGENEIEGKKIE